jgi:hypothetical protein
MKRIELLNLTPTLVSFMTEVKGKLINRKTHYLLLDRRNNGRLTRITLVDTSRVVIDDKFCFPHFIHRSKPLPNNVMTKNIDTMFIVDFKPDKNGIRNNDTMVMVSLNELLEHRAKTFEVSRAVLYSCSVN